MATDRGAVPEASEPPPARFVVPALAAVYLIWGSTYLAMRVAVEVLPPFYMAGVRFSITGVVLLAILKARGAPWPTAKEWLLAVPVGGLMFVLGNGTVAMAEVTLSSGVAAIVCGTMPLWVAAMSPLFGERATAREWLGLVLGFGGVVVLGFGQELRSDPLAAAILFVAPTAWALGSLLARRLPLAKGLMSAATQMVAGGVLMSGLSVWAGEEVPKHLPTRTLVAWVYLGVFGSLVAYSAYTYLLKTTRPAVATSYSYVNPAIAVLVGALLGGEAVGFEMVVSLVLIIAATAIVTLKARRLPVPATAAAPAPTPAESTG